MWFVGYKKRGSVGCSNARVKVKTGCGREDDQSSNHRWRDREIPGLRLGEEPVGKPLHGLNVQRGFEACQCKCFDLNVRSKSGRQFPTEIGGRENHPRSIQCWYVRMRMLLMAELTSPLPVFRVGVFANTDSRKLDCYKKTCVC